MVSYQDENDAARVANLLLVLFYKKHFKKGWQPSVEVRHLVAIGF